ncbi:hypothetical protein N1851_013016 [Merluccius polli]|uniref:Protein huluwa-like n=1 Tax=Merluccius polli TaxID=89951 RepID=A0AA47MVL6_MERPO|nr:hypothetical protein N1851_013016 [Merluccius polli]
MSQVGVAPPKPQDAFPVTTLTTLILSLLPCVVVLLLLNCVFLAHKLLRMSKSKTQRHRYRRDSQQETLLDPRVSTRTAEARFFPDRELRRIYASASASKPAAAAAAPPRPLTSSRTSSAGGDHHLHHHGMRFLRPDGATGTGTGTGSGSLTTAPSTILAHSGDVKVLRGVGGPGPVGWGGCALFLRRSGDSDADADTRSDHVPPNSPAVDFLLQGQLLKSLDGVRRSSTLESLANMNDHAGLPPLPPPPLDKVELECEYPLHHNSVAMMTSSCLSTSMVGPGLDSDFGASAGVSLRIVSADSDGLANGAVAVALEWDYYDPCYIQQNSAPVHKASRPCIHAKQYWV